MKHTLNCLGSYGRNVYTSEELLGPVSLHFCCQKAIKREVLPEMKTVLAEASSLSLSINAELYCTTKSNMEKKKKEGQ